MAAMVAMVLAAGSWALTVPTARADSAPQPATATDPVTVSADALPTVQIDGVAWAQVVVGDTVYVAGSFTRARPAGAPAGTAETVRNNLLAYDIRTGALVTSFAPSLNAQAVSVAASPDGTRIYVGGDFTVADGQPRNRIAAYDTRTGALVDSFRPTVNGQVAAIAATGTTVYLGGNLTAVGGVSRTRLAAVRASDGGLLPWAPVPGIGPTSGNRNPTDPSKPGSTATSNDVKALVVTGGGSQVVVAGRFDTMNGVKATGVTALDPTTGATRTFEINRLITNQGVNSAVWSLSTDGATVYGTGYDYYGPGNLEGSFAVDAANGRVRWIADCRGDSYSSFPANGVLYIASHAHSCVNIGGYPEQDPKVEKRATAMSAAAAGRVGPSTQRNQNFTGQPTSALLNWFPLLSQGSVTGQYQAGWSVSGNGQYVVYAGEFPRVNSKAQQGLVRFAVPSIAPNAVGPEVTPGVGVTATSGGLRVSWQGATDQDNRVLTYRVYRDNGAQPVATFARSSLWWRVAPVAWTDRTAAAGAHTYRVTVTDPFGNEAAIGTGSGTSSGPTPARAYASAVATDGATDHWSLGERSGTARSDLTGIDDLVGSGDVRHNWSGALRGDADGSTWFDGVGGFLSTQTPRRGPHTFSVEAWFETRSTAGGRIVGFGDQRTGLSNNHDRMIFLDPSGRLHFGVYPGFGAELVTPTAYNDGQWHHVVATLGTTGMQLFVDGRLVASRTDVVMAQDYLTGYWRIGGDRTWSGAPYFNGLIDEVAVYPTILSAEQVARHHAIGTTGTSTNLAPTASFSSSVQGLTGSFDGRLSADPDGGSLSRYAWDFGDGTTATGATATRTYASGGTYTVRLTVTDAAGATGTTERQVAVVAPANKPPTAAFTSTSSGLSAAVDARSSTDTDGTIASYSWAWGDSTPNGSGATASHTYATAGTYQVALTVTDDDGAVSTVTRAVVVTAPGATPPVASDSFARSVTGGLGTADLGGAWTAAIGASRQSVSGGAAVLTLPAAGNDTGAYLGSVSTTSADLRTSFTLTSTPTGNGTYVYVIGRRVGSGQDYTVRSRVAADGRVWLALSRTTGGVESFPGGEVLVPGVTWTPGKTLELRVQVSGTGTTTVDGSVWLSGQPEPTAAQLTRTDTTAALQGPGGVGIGAYRPGNSTAATSVRFGPLTVTAVGASQPPVEEPPAEDPPVEEPPANQAPVAAFTATPADLAVAVDASTSTDPDGTVSSYAWNWGDGTPAGTGPTASHTYAAAGTYTVTLTVTDDDGATATTTRPVTVAAAGEPQPQVLAADTFERSSTGGLGTADTGGAWTTLVGAARQAVTGGAAVLTVGPGNNAGSHLASVSQTAVDVRTTVSFSRVPTNGTGAYAFVTGRRVGTAMYNARVRVLPGGEVGVSLVREVGGVETTLGFVTLPGLTYTADLPLHVHLRVAGTGTTNLELTVWRSGTTRPTAPTLVRTDTTAVLQAAGSVGLAAYLSGSSTTPVAVRFDDLQVTATQ
ncbi:radical SAM protein [Blastococcus sp. TBT05-19]|uniref:PKD domain-containing protein n=1 Tax=Blastococcus sp. TBT05-19 TaxID=2250581 RepID=UPI000DEA2FC2|nr:PKD domain-containing protein [Blastococcus sp. TBT05-19]RBY94249.1 radical SAM protein [Blastococcus sp. TBT05-19]